MDAPVTDAPARQSRFSLRRVAAVVGVIVAAAIAAVVAIGFVTVGREVGPGRLEMNARFAADSDTQLAFPPLGRVSAATHDAPVSVRVQVAEVDVDRLQRVLNEPDPEETLRTEVEEDLDPLLRAYATRAVLVAVVVGALVGAFVPRRRFAYAAVGAVAGGCAVALLLFGTWRGYEPEAFDEPEFSGALERAPQVIAAVERHVDDLTEIRDRVDVLSVQLSRLYSVVTSPPEPAEDETVRILHVSDIHSNPLALELVDGLADRFDVAAVLDTGDLTSFGYPIESQVGALIRRIDVPYLFVPGNHDSDENRRGIDAVRNVQLLDGTVADIDGVRILGVADPTFTASNEIDGDQEAAIKAEFVPEVAALVRRHRPDVLAVHDRRIATAAYGSVPLVVSGHTHKPRDVVEGTTRVLNVGSTGASGLGSFTVDDDLAYEAQVLHFADGKLRVVDYLWLEGLSGNYRIERRLVTDPASEDG